DFSAIPHSAQSSTAQPAAHTAPLAPALLNARKSPMPINTLPAAATSPECADGGTRDGTPCRLQSSGAPRPSTHMNWVARPFSLPRPSSTGSNSIAPPPQSPIPRSPLALPPVGIRLIPAPPAFHSPSAARSLSIQVYLFF